ncbi:unnamed protein product [Cladocopium goreaui]|uniref:Eukaryotic translation initiation factor 4E (eIF-4E) (eIF4E) (eIF-4F 25 kDa subunit) (mRNA cap-binding protein) n=1 Tax=Cladocopium goreaui TaxID=2562237 RepID=A0A9P1GBN0_9DINO|nr:unnamed protein product [Cladocopium goreaui]
MTTFLSFNENFNSKLTFTAEDSAETEEMLRKDLPLSHRWSVWEQIMPTSESKGIYADATQKVASFGTVQDFWRFWNHIPQPSELLEQKRLVREHPDGLRVIDALMIFQENIRPEWEDKMNANGGHFQFQLKPSCGGGQIDEYWNNLVMGMIGATIDPPNMITGVRLVDKLSGPRASNVIRIEVWFTENEDSQAIGFFRALATTSKRMKKISAHAEEMMEALKDFDEKMEKEVRDLSKEEGWTLVDAYIERASTSALKLRGWEFLMNKAAVWADHWHAAEIAGSQSNCG